MPVLTAELERELEGTPELAELQRESRTYNPADYPKPSQGDVFGELARLRTDFDVFHEQIREGRRTRYLRDQMPEKWAAQLEIAPDQHIRSRLGHNMIMRIAAMATRNPPKFKIEPAGGKDQDTDRAVKQTRWLNNLWPALERTRAKRRELIDNQAGDGLGVLEIYRSGAYDGLDLKRRDDEDTRAYMKRTEPMLMAAKPPYGVRRVDPLCLLFDEDGDPDDPTCMAIMEEEVPTKPLFSAMARVLGGEEYAKWQARRSQGVSGQPKYTNDGREQKANTITCVRYYDRRWMAYYVDGVEVETVEHQFGFVPLVFYEGMTTGSPNLSQRYQGVFWGMGDLEKSVNWLTTLDVDNAFALSKPKIAITLPNPGERGIPSQRSAGPVDFSGGKVPRLDPGEVPVNLTETFRGIDTAPVVQRLMSLIQISGLNPIAQGESPGSDPAGYAINALQSAAQSNYEVLLDNAARGDADLGNKLRRLIKEDLKETWYLTTRGGTRRQKAAAWLGLGPDDVDDTPCEVTIDPLSDVNRIAVQQAKRQANKEGFVARWRVQESYGIDDYELEDEDILEDTLEAELGRLAIEEAKMAVMEAQQPQQGSGLVDQYGNPMPPSGAPQAAGATPAPPQPPSVGGDASGASSAPFATAPGPDAQPGNPGGFDRGQRPPGAGGA